MLFIWYECMITNCETGLEMKPGHTTTENLRVKDGMQRRQPVGGYLGALPSTSPGKEVDGVCYRRNGEHFVQHYQCG